MKNKPRISKPLVTMKDIQKDTGNIIQKDVDDMIGLPSKSGKKSGKKKRQLTHAQKLFAWEHKPHVCLVCHKRVKKLSDAAFDHIRAYSKGGATNLGNVRIVHRKCNELKGKKTLGKTQKELGTKKKK